MNTSEILTSYSVSTERLNSFYNYHATTQYVNQLIKNCHYFSNMLTAIDYENLSIDQQIDYHILKRRIDADLEKLLDKFNGIKAVSQWEKIGRFIIETATASQQGTTPTPKKFAQQLKKAYEEINLKLKTLTNQVSHFGHKEGQILMEMIRNQKEALAFLSKQFDEYLPNYYVETNKYKTAYEIQLDSLNAIVLKQFEIPKIQYLGKDKLQQQLTSVRYLPYSVDEIYKISEEFFNKSQKETELISKEMGFETDWKQAYEKVKNSYVVLGEQPKTVQRLQNEALDFIEEKELITIPDILKETWSIGMVPDFLQQRAPFFLGGPKLLISYPTLDMNKDDKLQIMRMNNPHFARSVIFHELIPGHFMQYYMEDIKKPYRKGYSFSALWSEGMAFYWELLLYDKGFAKTNEDKLGMLFFQKLRAARVITSINYHTQKWTKEECISFFKNKVGADHFVAIAETNRAVNSYPIDYLIGGLQFMRLKEELVDTGKMSLKVFNDKLFKENFIPLDLLEFKLKNRNIPKPNNGNRCTSL
ncbi:DUF885 family protein [Pontimicrobium sp. MEBiC06410]